MIHPHGRCLATTLAEGAYILPPLLALFQFSRGADLLAQDTFSLPVREANPSREQSSSLNIFHIHDEMRFSCHDIA
jgi:hypothetical protein